MTDRVLGVDLAAPVTEQLVAQVSAVLGQLPAFWGRYFTSIATTGNVEYRHRIESPVLRAHGIRVLPIARQTNRVGGTEAEGESDGLANGRDIVATFGEDYLVAQGARFFIFLDVEGSGLSRLSSAYYQGWVKGLGRSSVNVELLPCVYGIPGDSETWKVLDQAMKAGTPCHGLWMSHPVVSAEPVEWDSGKATPMGAVVDAPVLFWQYMFPRAGLGCDRNQCNPIIDAAQQILPRLILPSEVAELVA